MLFQYVVLKAATLISLGIFVSSYVGNELVIIVRNYVNCEVNLYL